MRTSSRRRLTNMQLRQPARAIQPNFISTIAVVKICFLFTCCLQNLLNVLVVDWKTPINYFKSLALTESVAKNIAQILGKHARRIWCIGHSVGFFICQDLNRMYHLEKITGEYSILLFRSNNCKRLYKVYFH